MYKRQDDDGKSKLKRRQPLAPLVSSSSSSSTTSSSNDVDQTKSKDWIAQLQKLLISVGEQRKKHRYDFKRVTVEEKHLNMAIRVWEHVSGSTTKQLDDIISANAEAFEVKTLSMWQFLKGNSKLFGTIALQELVDLWEKWLDANLSLIHI